MYNPDASQIVFDNPFCMRKGLASDGIHVQRVFLEKNHASGASRLVSEHDALLWQFEKDHRDHVDKGKPKNHKIKCLAFKIKLIGSSLNNLNRLDIGKRHCFF